VKKKPCALIFLVLVLGISFILPQRAWAMDNYTHDADISRDNTVVDPSFLGLEYNNAPYYVEIPKWNGYEQYSNTTPVVVGSELYQYTYDGNGKGYLSQIDLQKPQSGWTQGNAISLNATLIATFDEGSSGANGEVDSAAGISGPTISNGYLTIAVGEYLYWWQVDQNGRRLSTTSFQNIQGNPGNSIQLIAASPLITPSLTATGIDTSTGDTVTWQTPFAIVGSWSGGVISQPLYSPANVSVLPNFYKTTDDASNATNDIVTSSPAWDSHTTAIGTQGAAVFGVDAAQSGEYRLILMDPTTGTPKTIYEAGGSPIFYGPIDSSPAISYDGTIFVPDQGAAVYQLSANGDYEADDISAMDQSNPCIANIALDGHNVIWVGNGHTTLNAVPINMFGQGANSISGFNGLDSPAVVQNNSTDTVFLASTGVAGLLVTNPLNIDGLPVSFQQDKFTWQNTWQTLGSLTPAYTSVSADVGTDSTDGTDLHDLATWTNYGFDTQGCVELWAPADYGVTATVNPNILNSGDQGIVNAFPSPEGITAGMIAHITDGGTNTFDLTLAKNWSAPENWGMTFTAPNNYTGHPDNYTVTVTATNISGEKATSTTAFTVNPIPLPPPGNLSGTLNIVAYRRNGATQPLGTAKYSDDLVATLTVPTPPPPSGLLNAEVTGAWLTNAWVHTPQGSLGKDGNGVIQIVQSAANINMTLNGLTATCKYKENWAGYPPPIPDNTVMETDYIDAPYAVHVEYEYQVPVSTKNGIIYVWETGSYDTSGNASTNLDITGTEVYGYDEGVVNHDSSAVWEP